MGNTLQTIGQWEIGLLFKDNRKYSSKNRTMENTFQIKGQWEILFKLWDNGKHSSIYKTKGLPNSIQESYEDSYWTMGNTLLAGKDQKKYNLAT